MQVAVVDYGLGNLFNIQIALQSIDIRSKVVDKSDHIKVADRLLLPGVGAYQDGMKGLSERGLTEPIRDFVKSGKPVLGICLGMQLLFSESSEFGRCEGLNIVSGKITSLTKAKDNTEFKIPHMGWNTLKIAQSPLFVGFEKEVYTYFLHSYFAIPDDKRCVIATTQYGYDEFCSAFQSENVVGFQPHLERSGPAGLQILDNFFKM